MKFWISIIAATIVVTGVSTAVYFANPDLVVKPAPTVTAPPAPTGALPKLVAESTEEDVASVAQNHKGTSSFFIRNDGEANLHMSKQSTSCTCSALRFVSLDGRKFENDQLAELKPGERIKLEVDWDTGARRGDFAVNAVLRSNDPLRPTASFTVKMKVEQDLHFSPEVLLFGTLVEGRPTEGFAYVYSKLHENVDFSFLSCSAPAVKVSLSPMSESELAKFKAKCGKKIDVKIDGIMPVGDFLESIVLKTSLTRIPQIQFQVYGVVTGKIELIPSRVDFQVVSGQKPEQRKVSISARGMEEGRTLKVASVEPKFLETRIERDPAAKVLWRLVITIPTSAPPGPFKGAISIADDKGVKRVNIGVSGTVKGNPTTTPVASSP